MDLRDGAFIKVCVNNKIQQENCTGKEESERSKDIGKESNKRKEKKKDPTATVVKNKMKYKAEQAGEVVKLVRGREHRSKGSETKEDSKGENRRMREMRGVK